MPVKPSQIRKIRTIDSIHSELEEIIQLINDLKSIHDSPHYNNALPNYEDMLESPLWRKANKAGSKIGILWTGERDALKTEKKAFQALRSVFYTYTHECIGAIVNLMENNISNSEASKEIKRRLDLRERGFEKADSMEEVNRLNRLKQEITRSKQAALQHIAWAHDLIYAIADHTKYLFHTLGSMEGDPKLSLNAKDSFTYINEKEMQELSEHITAERWEEAKRKAKDHLGDFNKSMGAFSKMLEYMQYYSKRLEAAMASLDLYRNILHEKQQDRKQAIEALKAAKQALKQAQESLPDILKHTKAFAGEVLRVENAAGFRISA